MYELQETEARRSAKRIIVHSWRAHKLRCKLSILCILTRSLNDILRLVTPFKCAINKQSGQIYELFPGKKYYKKLYNGSKIPEKLGFSLPIKTEKEVCQDKQYEIFEQEVIDSQYVHFLPVLRCLEEVILSKSHSNIKIKSLSTIEKNWK